MENKLDKKKYLQKVIILSWIALAVCFVIKLFGGNIFQIACNNQHFIAICNYADTHLWLNYIISVVYSFISLYFFILAILQRTKYKPWEFVVFSISTLIGVAIKVFWSNKIGFIFDIWTGIIMPIIFLGKNYKCYWKIILANLLLMLFQIISMITKQVETINVYDSGVLVSFIFGIDVLIMVILYFAYANLLNNKKYKKES